jgi:hypothetical protein
MCDQAVTSASSGASLGAPVNSMLSTVMSSLCPNACACWTMAAAYTWTPDRAKTIATVVVDPDYQLPDDDRANNSAKAK